MLGIKNQADRHLSEVDSSEALKPISETVLPQLRVNIGSPRSRRANGETLGVLVAPKVTYTVPVPGSPKRKITPHFNAFENRNVDRSQRYENAFMSKSNGNANKSKNIVEVFDSSKLRKPKMTNIQDVPEKDTTFCQNSKPPDPEYCEHVDVVSGIKCEYPEPKTKALQEVENISVLSSSKEVEIPTLTQSNSENELVNTDGDKAKENRESLSTTINTGGRDASLQMGDSSIITNGTCQVIKQTLYEESDITSTRSGGPMPDSSITINVQKTKQTVADESDSKNTAKVKTKDGRQPEEITSGVTNTASYNLENKLCPEKEGFVGFSETVSESPSQYISKQENTAITISVDTVQKPKQHTDQSVNISTSPTSAADDKGTKPGPYITTVVTEGAQKSQQQDLKTKSLPPAMPSQQVSLDNVPQQIKSTMSKTIVGDATSTDAIKTGFGEPEQTMSALTKSQVDKAEINLKTRKTPNVDGTSILKPPEPVLHQTDTHQNSLTYFPMDKSSIFKRSAPERHRKDSMSTTVVRRKESKHKSSTLGTVMQTRNASIPKRKTHFRNRIADSNSPNMSRIFRDLLQQKGFGEFQVSTTSCSVEIPVYTLSNLEKTASIDITSLKNVEEAIQKAKPEVVILESQDTNVTVLGESLKKMAPNNTSDVITKQQIQEKQNSKTDLQPINKCINEIKLNPENYHIQLEGCKLIGQYAELETLEVVLYKEEGVKCIFQAIKQYPEKPELVAASCQSILQIASLSESNCELLCKCNGIPVLLDLYKKNNDELQTTIITIWSYFSVSETLAYTMIQLGVHGEVLTAMTRRSDDSNIVQQCLFILGNLVINEETAKRIMLVGGVHTVLSLMEKFNLDFTVLENGCRALGSFAVFDATCLDVAQAGATITVLSVVSKPQSDVPLPVIECALWALSCLTSTVDACEDVVSLEAEEAVFGLMESHPEDETIQEYGVRIICNLSTTDVTCSRVSSSRVLDILIRLISAFPENLNILEFILTALLQTVLTIESQESFFQNGLSQMKDVMTSFPEHPGIQEQGCRIIGNIAVYEKLRKKIEYCDVSKLVINAMLCLESSPAIQECGCMTLMNLTASVQANKMTVSSNGGVSALLACLRNFEDKPEIAVAAIKTLGNLICLEEVCQDILEENGLRTINNIGIKHIGHSEISVFTAAILAVFIGISELSLEETERIDGTLVRTLHHWNSNVDVCLSVCHAMENMINTENGRAIFINDERMPILLRCMSSYIYHSDIQKIGCKVIAVLAMDPETCELVTRDCVEIIIKIMKIFQDDLEHQIICCGALTCILENNCDMADVVLKGEVVECVSVSLSLHQKDQRLHVLVLMVLGNLATSADDNTANTIHRMVLLTMGRFSENYEIQSYACSTICRLQFGEEKQDVDNVLVSVRHALRRHSTRNEVVQSAGQLLRRLSEVGHREKVEDMLESSLPRLPDYFWRSVKHINPYAS